MQRQLEIVLFAIALLVSAAIANAQDAVPARVEVRVLPRVEVSGAEFTLGEVAEVDGLELERVRRVAAVSLGRSPLPGRTLRLNESFVRARLAQTADIEPVELTVPPGTEVVRASQIVTGEALGERVLAFAAEQAEGQDGALTQELAAPIQDAVLPLGEVEWEIEALGRHLAAGGSRSFRVYGRIHGEEVLHAMVRVNQQVYRNVVLAQRPIRRGHVIRAEDVTTERKLVSGVRADAYLTRAADVIGTRTKRPIGQSEWIHKGLLVALADVAEGGPVVLLYQTDYLRFTAPGVAMVPAKVGEFIPVRNLQSGKIVHGVVQKDETVKVN